MNLYVFYIGGAVSGAHLELHDMRFCIGETPEACWPALKAQWWGEPTSLHLDAWGPLHWADGHAVALAAEPPSGASKLFFVHLGGYDPALFTELHHNCFIVAEDARAAKQRALAQLDGWVSPHRDAQMEVDSVIDVAAAMGDAPLHVHLTPDAREVPFAFEARYLPIGRMEASSE